MPLTRPPGSRGWTAAWLLLWASCASGLTAVDAVLLEMNNHYFSGGFLAAHAANSVGRATSFVVTALVIDAWIVAAAWVVALPVLRRLPLSPVQRFALAGALGLAGPAMFDLVQYELQTYLGDVADWRLIIDLAGGRPLEALAQGSAHLVPLAVAVGATGAGGLGLLLALGLLGGRGGGWLEPPPARALGRALGALSVAVALALPALCAGSASVCFGLRRKSGGLLASQALHVMTDFDLDGYSLMSQPPDPEGFDGSIHPYATDVPGNGIDENGLAGDHPPGVVHAALAAERAPRWPATPHVLLVFLESFRGDLLEREHAGVEITPFINRLAAEGGRARAYANTPYTTAARGQLFGGRLAPYPGQTTLIDDFKRNGYHVAYFSGQNDAFGGSEALVGAARADDFYDARDDEDLRYTRFATRGSLAVSWKLLNRRVSGFLERYDASTPLFLYVNYHDTHFPYHHREMDLVLIDDPLPRERIRPGAIEALWATYANGAANVDRAVRELVETWRRAVGDDGAIVITADHGQALFESGYLGHGQSLRDDQARVPLVLWGIGGLWPEPIGLADVRGLIQRNLPLERDGGRPRPRLAAPDDRAILLFTSSLARPRLVGLRGADWLLVRDFRTGALEYEDAEGARLDAQRAQFERLVWRWEAAVLAAEGS